MGAEYEEESVFCIDCLNHCDDFVPGSELIVNGNRYIEFTLSIDLDVSEDLPYGNQFEWSVASSVKTWILTDETTFNASQKEKVDVNQTGYITPRPDLFPSALEKELGTVLRVSYRPMPEEVYYAYYIVKYSYKEYERIVPLITSWGSSQSLNGFQLLRNKLLSEDYLKKAQLFTRCFSRAWAITFTMLF